MIEPQDQHKPEGVSVMVAAHHLTGDALVEVAAMIAAAEYPGIELRQPPHALHVGMDEFAEGLHEVVLEVA